MSGGKQPGTQGVLRTGTERPHTGHVKHVRYALDTTYPSPAHLRHVNVTDREVQNIFRLVFRNADRQYDGTNLCDVSPERDTRGATDDKTWDPENTLIAAL